VYDFFKKSPYYITHDKLLYLGEERYLYTFSDEGTFYFLYIPLSFDCITSSPIAWHILQSENPYNMHSQPQWFRELYHQAIESYYKKQRLRLLSLGKRRNIHSVIHSYSVFWDEKVGAKLSLSFYNFSSMQKDIPLSEEYHSHVLILKEKFTDEFYEVIVSDINSDGFFFVSIK